MLQQANPLGMINELWLLGVKSLLRAALLLVKSHVVEWKWRHIGVAGFEGLWGGGIGSGISCSRSPYARCDDGLTDVDSVWPHRLMLPLWRDVWRVINAENRLLVLRNKCASRLHANSCTVMSYIYSRWSTEWVSCHAEAETPQHQ